MSTTTENTTPAPSSPPHKRPPKVNSIIKRPGGKTYLCRRIWDVLPKTASWFIEPYCGGASITLNREVVATQGVVVNDMDWRVTSVLGAVKHAPQSLKAMLEQKPYGIDTFNTAKVCVAEYDAMVTRGVTPSMMDRAVEYIRVNRMSRSGLDKHYGWSDRLRGGQPEYLNAWQNAIDGLGAVSQRLQGVWVSQVPAEVLIHVHDDDPDALFYLDPPYPHGTRVTKDMYQHEMSTDHHVRLLELIKHSRARMAISGYRCDLYDDMLGDWTRHEWDIANHMSQKKNKQRKVECLWTNF